MAKSMANFAALPEDSLLWSDIKARRLLLIRQLPENTPGVLRQLILNGLSFPGINANKCFLSLWMNSLLLES